MKLLVCINFPPGALISGKWIKHLPVLEVSGSSPAVRQGNKTVLCPAAIPPQILVCQVWPTEQLTCLPSSHSVSAIIVAHFQPGKCSHNWLLWRGFCFSILPRISRILPELFAVARGTAYRYRNICQAWRWPGGKTRTGRAGYETVSVPVFESLLWEKYIHSLRDFIMQSQSRAANREAAAFPASCPRCSLVPDTGPLPSCHSLDPQQLAW